MNKPKIKSKTIQGVLVVALMFILQVLGVGEAERAKTYDALGDDVKNDNIKQVVGLVGAGYAFYGRTQVGKDKKE